MILALAGLSGWLLSFFVGYWASKVCPRFVTNVLMGITAPIGIILYFLVPSYL